MGDRQSGDGRYNPHRPNVALAPGARLEPYEVIAKPGQDVTGEVYHAPDTRLNCGLAIEVLPDLFASDPERLARFEREAQLLFLRENALGALGSPVSNSDAARDGRSLLTVTGRQWKAEQLAVVVNWLSDWQRLGSGAPSGARH